MSFVGFTTRNDDGVIEVLSGDVQYLRRKARQFRRAARNLSAELSRRLNALADEFDARAAEIETQRETEDATE